MRERANLGRITDAHSPRPADKKKIKSESQVIKTEKRSEKTRKHRKLIIGMYYAVYIAI